MSKPEQSPTVKSNDFTQSHDALKTTDTESTNRIPSNDRTSNSSSDSVFTSPKVPPLIPDAENQGSQTAKSWCTDVFLSIKWSSRVNCSKFALFIYSASTLINKKNMQLSHLKKLRGVHSCRTENRHKAVYPCFNSFIWHACTLGARDSSTLVMEDNVG